MTMHDTDAVADTRGEPSRLYGFFPKIRTVGRGSIEVIWSLHSRWPIEVRKDTADRLLTREQIQRMPIRVLAMSDRFDLSDSKQHKEFDSILEREAQGLLCITNRKEITAEHEKSSTPVVWLEWREYYKGAIPHVAGQHVYTL